MTSLKMMIVAPTSNLRVRAMLLWIVLVLALYLAQLFIPSLFRIAQPDIGLVRYVGSRDDLPSLSPFGGRSERAARNFAESLPFFLTAAVLTIVLDRETTLSLVGAQLFFWARLVYLGLYLAAVPWLRSIMWTIAFAGIVMMAWPFFGPV
jgi:uncharacterized MAPEG superfamily protein